MSPASRKQHYNHEGRAQENTHTESDLNAMANLAGEPSADALRVCLAGIVGLHIGVHFSLRQEHVFDPLMENPLASGFLLYLGEMVSYL